MRDKSLDYQCGIMRDKEGKRHMVTSWGVSMRGIGGVPEIWWTATLDGEQIFQKQNVTREDALAEARKRLHLPA